jgi:hypothetical protein
MELNLTFKEKEIRDIYAISFETLESQFNSRLKERRKTTIAFVSLTILFFLLSYLHFDWIYLSIFVAGLTLLFNLWTWRLGMRTKNKINADKKSVEDFINNHWTIGNIKYIYDHQRIEYYESGNLKVKIRWDDFLGADQNDQWIHVRFKKPYQNIWIPRATVDKLEMDNFEQLLAQRIQDTR